MKNFRTLKSAVEFYSLTQTLTLKGHLKDQLSRASLSISLNLAEGASRHTLKERKRFFNIALGSLRECQVLLMILGYENTEIWNSLDSVAAQLFRLIQNAR
jgi:four helix bundle protein